MLRMLERNNEFGVKPSLMLHNRRVALGNRVLYVLLIGSRSSLHLSSITPRIPHRLKCSGAPGGFKHLESKNDLLMGSWGLTVVSWAELGFTRSSIIVPFWRPKVTALQHNASHHVRLICIDEYMRHLFNGH
jgi:hypothetical protein